MLICITNAAAMIMIMSTTVLCLGRKKNFSNKDMNIAQKISMLDQKNKNIKNNVIKNELIKKDSNDPVEEGKDKKLLGAGPSGELADTRCDELLYPPVVEPTPSAKRKRDEELEKDKKEKIKEGFYQSRSDEDDTLEPIKSLKDEDTDPADKSNTSERIKAKKSASLKQKKAKQIKKSKAPTSAEQNKK